MVRKEPVGSNKRSVQWIVKPRGAFLARRDGVGEQELGKQKIKQKVGEKNPKFLFVLVVSYEGR